MKATYPLLNIRILTKDRPDKLALTLMSLQYVNCSIEIFDVGDIPATEQSSLRNMIDLLSIFHKKEIIIRRRKNISIQENRRLMLEDVFDDYVSILDDDIIVTPGCYAKLWETLKGCNADYVVPVCIDMNNSLRHPDYSSDIMKWKDAEHLPKWLWRHRLWESDELIPVPYSEASTLLMKGKSLRAVDWKKVSRKGETDMITGVKLTKELGRGYLRTGAVTYHNTDSHEWFTRWRQIFGDYVKREMNKNAIT